MHGVARERADLSRVSESKREESTLRKLLLKFPQPLVTKGVDIGISLIGLVNSVFTI